MGTTWATAISATPHCPTGCAVGEVLGVVGTWLGLPNRGTVVPAVTFAFGCAFTLRGVPRAGVAFGAALKPAPAADTVSIAVAEVIDNTIVPVVPGAMESGLAGLLSRGAGLLAGRGVRADRAGQPVAHLARQGARRRAPRPPPLGWPA